MISPMGDGCGRNKYFKILIFTQKKCTREYVTSENSGDLQIHNY